MFYVLAAMLLPFAVTLSHWVGDYILQIPFKDMAVKKKIDPQVAIIHCFIYTIAHIPMLWFYSLGSWEFVLVGFTLIFVLHFFQDYFEFPLGFFMKKIRGIGMWEPVLYVAIDNGYHWLTNYAIILGLFILAIMTIV